MLENEVPQQGEQHEEDEEPHVSQIPSITPLSPPKEAVASESNSVTLSSSSSNSQFDCPEIVHEEESTFSHTKLNLKMLPTLKKRGRPKGSETTNVVGVKRKKKVKSPGVETFLQKDRAERENLIVKWCVGTESAEQAIKSGSQLTIDDLNIVNIDPALFNTKFVCINSVKYLFTEPAWSRLLQMVETKKNEFVWMCRYCDADIESSQEFANCNKCLMRFHASCTEKRRKYDWICKFCRVDKNQKYDFVIFLRYECWGGGV